jgi:hypothetical protein
LLHEFPAEEPIMTRLTAAFFALLAALAISRPASAHCDTTRGPVVTAARAALDAGDPKLVLHWVRPEDEPAIEAAFEHTLGVRALGPEAKALADRYFLRDAGAHPPRRLAHPDEAATASPARPVSTSHREISAASSAMRS